VLDSLFAARTVSSIQEAVGELGKVAVIGNVRIARALAEHAAKAWIVDADEQKLKRLGRGEPVCASPAKLPFDDGQLDTLIAIDVARQGDPAASLAEWRRVVKPGGVIAIVDRGPSAEISGRLLCAGLLDIEQRDAGRALVVRAATPTW
jgi:SAM-dependent methyltransferase